MGKVYETKIENFTGGISNDPRSTANGVSAMVTNFDIFTDYKRAIPYYSSEDGDSGSATSQKQNFAVALRTGTTYSLYGLGVVSGQTYAEVMYKDLTSGAANDLDDNAWASPTANQSSAGATSFNLFTYYKKTGLIYGARAGTHIWAFSPTGTAWADTSHALSYTNICEGLVHSKDDIMYVGYDNNIAKNNNGSWTDIALALPSHYYVTALSEYRDYLAIAVAPLSGYGKSRVYLWDRDSSLTTVSQSIDWGDGVIKVIEELDGRLIGISQAGGAAAAVGAYFDNSVILRVYDGYSAKQFAKLAGGVNAVTLYQARQKVRNRIYFMMSLRINGAIRDGVWSVGLSSSGAFAVSHERTPENDVVLGGILRGFIIAGDYMFISYTTAGSAFKLSKTDYQSYTASSIYESVIFSGGDSGLTKKLIGVTVTTEPLPAAGQVVLKYREDAETTYGTTIFTHTTDDSISHDAVNVESTGANLPEYSEIQFRIESTGGAVITGLKFKYEIIDKAPY